MFKISINNQIFTFKTTLCLAQALTEAGYDDFTGIAIAVNQSFVPKSEYAERGLANGDQIDVVQAINGG